MATRIDTTAWRRWRAQKELLGWNSVVKLQRRELGPRPWPVSSAARGGALWEKEKFGRILLQEEFDITDPGNKRTENSSKVCKIIVAEEIIFTLLGSGVCAAFSRITNKRICFLNLGNDEYIENIFYNKSTESLVMVFLYGYEIGSARCREIQLESIRSNQLEAGRVLFGNEKIRNVEHIHFDNINDIVLIYLQLNGTCKIFDQQNFTYMYSLVDTKIQDLKISPGTITLINKNCRHILLKMFAIEDGRLLKSLEYFLVPRRKLAFIKQFNEKIMIKQEKENLRILDARTSEVVEVEHSESMPPPPFISLPGKDYFLTVQDGIVRVYSIRGKLVMSFNDHRVWQRPFCLRSLIQVTSDQNLIISYCRTRNVYGSDYGENPVGSINISDIRTGISVFKVCPYNPALQIAPRRPRGPKNRTIIKSTIKEALTKVTAIYYDEEMNELYTGNEQGVLHLWSD